MECDFELGWKSTGLQVEVFSFNLVNDLLKLSWINLMVTTKYLKPKTS